MDIDDMNKEFEDQMIQAAKLFEDSIIDTTTIEQSVYTMLAAIGEDPAREGLLRTPERVARAYTELYEGYRVDPVALINDALFESDCNSPVLIRDIEFFSTCEHHLLPVLGRVHVEYIPNGKVIGLSKIPRIVDMFAKRLQLQERMTGQIGNFINLVLDPRGVAVVVEGLHLCSMIRGVQKHDARMTTSCMLGRYKDDAVLRREFFENISRAAKPLTIGG